ncbi:unnamed protein product [Albugo candida]|uniref:Uncharacterized protein n=1 Tax=Albugo candida TaxID=65357 RepID=A0A024GGA4_9STRA|nr:unnamed protein product [Albugo candida]|eukprot:CCI45739.1 unnamed protein product [Albugo candida]
MKCPALGGLDDLHTVWDASPLHDAVREGNMEELKRILVENKGNLDERDKYGLTPLHWACDYEKLEVVKFLIKLGANTNAVENRLFKRTPLHFACLRGAKEIVQVLLEHHADPEARDYKGWSALHCGAYNGSEGVVEILIKARVNSHSVTKQGENARTLARQNEKLGVLSMLVDKSNRLQ